MNYQTYELWYSQDKDSYSFLSSDNPVKNELKNHVLVWKVQAKSWEEACRLYRKYIRSKYLEVLD